MANTPSVPFLAFSRDNEIVQKFKIKFSFIYGFGRSCCNSICSRQFRSRQFRSRGFFDRYYIIVVSEKLGLRVFDTETKKKVTNSYHP